MKLFYSAEYVLGKHAFDTTRKSGWIAESLQERPIANVEIVVPEPLDEGLLATVHDSAYIEAVRTGVPRDLAQSQGFTWDQGIWDMVLASNGGAKAAALDALANGVSGSLSSGLHHAKKTRGDGYCTFNGLVLAAHAALTLGGAQRILILDLDAHCGDGTSQLIGSYKGAIRHLDISVSEYGAYQPNAPNSLDLVWSAEDYLPRLRGRLHALKDHFDLILYNAGMDPYEGCREGGRKGITFDLLAERERVVFEWRRNRGIPLAFVLAGGYIGEHLSQEKLVDLHRLTIKNAAV